MSDPLLIVFLVLHIASAAAAFGVSLMTSGALRRAGTKGQAVMTNAAAEVNRAGRIASIFGIATLVTGFALIFYRGGFKVVSPTIHGAILLVTIMVVMGFFMQKPTGKKLETAALANDTDAWGKARKKWAMTEGIMQLMWIVTLVLMFIKIAR